MFDFVKLACTAGSLRVKLATEGYSEKGQWGGLGGALLVAGAGTGYAKLLDKPFLSKPVDPAVLQSQHFALLNEAERGRPVSLPSMSYDARPGNAPGYIPSIGVVKFSPTSSAGTVAHELGHSRQRYMHKLPSMIAYKAAMPGASLGMAGALMAKDEKTGLTSALLGTAATLPALGIEADASTRGYRMMRRILPKHGRMGALAAVAGLPTYAMTTAVPLATHYGKKLMGGYKQKGS